MEDANLLADSFPAEGFVRQDKGERVVGKRYRNFSRSLSWAEDRRTFGEKWCKLVSDILSTEYRSQVARLLEQERAADLELRFVCHGSGDWLEPHTDSDDKLFSHIIYFNRGWKKAWGGCLQILCDNDTNSVVATISPELGASVLLARASNSWHQVTPVSPDAPVQRRSLLIHGLR